MCSFKITLEMQSIIVKNMVKNTVILQILSPLAWQWLQFYCNDYDCGNKSDVCVKKLKMNPVGQHQ